MRWKDYVFPFFSIHMFVPVCIISVVIYMNVVFIGIYLEEHNAEKYTVTAQLTKTEKVSWEEQRTRTVQVGRDGTYREKKENYYVTVEGYDLTYTYTINGKEGSKVVRTTFSPDIASPTKEVRLFVNKDGNFQEIRLEDDHPLMPIILTDLSTAVLCTVSLCIGIRKGIESIQSKKSLYERENAAVLP
ncbi:MAG: hypothetical protein K5695_02730 [Oscillospiraceae bacterium]|nr:hypothetical protein [Oscillospiraceae bacterium]